MLLALMALKAVLVFELFLALAADERARTMTS